MPRDAEAWLAERGIAREAIRLTPTSQELAEATRAQHEDEVAGGGPSGAGSEAPAAAPPTPDGTAGPAPSPTGAGHGPDPSVREVAQLAGAVRQATDDAAALDAAARDVGAPTLSDDVASALSFIRRSTATAPQSVGRLRSKLVERGTRPTVIELALERAHAERLVDDAAMAAALVDEGRAKGYAPTRLRADLERRGFDREVIVEALAVTAGEDLEAAAFDVARGRAQRLTGVAAETAVRRIVGQLARRGYPEGLARKVAREAVFTTRDAARAAGR